MVNFRHFLTLCAAAISTVSPIDLPNAVTSKPKHPKPPTTAGGNNGTNIKVTSDYVQYSVKESDGSTCILFRADAMIEVHFKSPIGNDKDDAYFPVNANISGECNDDDGLLRIVWSGYDLKFTFKKTPGGERWYIKEIDLVIDSATPRYHEIKHKLGKSFKLAHMAMLFLTPVGKSYSCDDITVNLEMPIEDKNPAGLRGVLLLRKFQVQPFMYKGSDFGPAFDCSTPAAFRDETAPIAVGSTLAIAVLATITGYAIYRHFKIKKVQYNTME